jgi:photosystem II stability/assembly factor-like uncharacterized protein
MMGITGKDARGGAELLSITVNGPADKAGLRPGDVITAIDDKPIRTYQELINLIRAHKAGDKVNIARRRNGVVLVVEMTFAPRQGGPGGGGDRPFLDRLGGQRENVQKEQGKDGFEYGGVYRSADGGETWNRVNSLNPRPMYFSQIRIDPSNDRTVYVLGIALYRSADGGATFSSDGGRRVHGDHHALWIDPRDPRHMILGNDGGVYVTFDRMSRWDYLNTMAIGQFYHVAVDSRQFYRAHGGTQDSGSWGGPTRTRGTTGPINEDWMRLSGGDGFTCRVDPKDPDLVYFTAQWGRMGRRNLRTREEARFQPQAPRGIEYRFNWNSPYILSHHDSRVLYSAGNHVFRSANRGSDLRPISPEITATKKGSATALAESPRNSNLLYVGTDDGFLWITRDGGKEWKNITSNLGLPGLRHVSSIEPSRYVEGRAYVVFDAHRSDDERPYVYVTDDFGQTWMPLQAGLPQWGTTRVLREDIENPNLLYLGTEFSLFCSLDRGQSWVKLNTNLPTVAIHEIAQHPTMGEIVAATHGRSLWVLDVSPLRKLNPQTMKAPATFFKPATTVRWIPDPSRGRTNRRFVGENPPEGAVLYYLLTRKAEKASLRLLAADGKELLKQKLQTKPGLHSFIWDLNGPPGPPKPGEEPEPVPVPAGTYRAVLTIDGVELTQDVKVANDPGAPSGGTAQEETQPQETYTPIDD